MEIPSTRIFNCDETYVSLCPLSEKVLLAKGSRSAYKVVDSDKEGFTVLFMYSANVLKFALDATAQEKNAVISGFKAAGLYPFDPSAVDYDVFDKRKKSKTTVTKENVQDEVTEDKEKHLLTFETNLSKNILKEFNTAWLNQTLPKDLEITSLYKYRLDVSERSGSHEKSKPTVKEVTQEQPVNNLINDQASTPNDNNNTDMNLNDHSHSFNEEFLPLITNPEIDTSASSEVLYEFKVDNKPIEIVSQAQSGTDQSKNLNLLNLSDVLEHNIGDELIFESNVLDADNQTDFLDSTSAITTVSTAACTTPTIDKYSELQECQTFSQALKPMLGILLTTHLRCQLIIYRRKKRIKLESSGKPKLPSAGTSDQWMQYHSTY
ncbi:Protein of unknown function [Cotesia congregata]|uniref:Uncharacterized protein n=1 Tax=Cotesia congregata TaxID=51543 RepID=A0A8J2H7R3_COTCN|nr:Protein of unknown function [Cotesia congregata]